MESALSLTCSAPIEELAREVIRSLTNVLLASGVQPHEIRRLVGECCVAADDLIPAAVPSQNLGELQLPCMKILCIWRRDPQYVDSQGLPRPLPRHGDAGSFDALVRQADPLARADLLFDTLDTFKAIRLLPDGRVEALAPVFLLAGGEGATSLAADGVLRQVAGFLRAIEHNVFTRDPDRRYFERTSIVQIPQTMLAVAQRVVESRGQEFVDSIDEWLTRHSATVSGSLTGSAEVGAGVYFFHLA